MLRDLRRLVNVCERHIALRYLRKRAFEPAETVQPQDVVIVGFPKSGHTWMQAILADLAYGVDPVVAPDNLIQDLVPDVHQNRMTRRYSDAVFFKSHQFPKKEYRQVIYMLRDGRDVLVSYYHYRRAWGYQGSIRDLVNEENPVYGSWGSHVRAWHQNPYSASIKVLKYENLLVSFHEELRNLAEFFKFDADSDRIDRIAEATKFKSLQDKERKRGRPNPNWPTDKLFMRRGVAGSFRDELDAGTLDLFENKFGDVLRECGYTM